MRIPSRTGSSTPCSTGSSRRTSRREQHRGHRSRPGEARRPPGPPGVVAGGGRAVRRAARARARVHRAAAGSGRQRRRAPQLRRRCAGRRRPAGGRAAPVPASREGAFAVAAARRAGVPRAEDHRVKIDLLPLSQISDALASGAASPEALLEASLARIRALDGRLHAFLRLTTDEAHAAAKASARRRSGRKPLGPLDGVPIALKDIFCMEGVETTCGSRILEGYVPPYDATVVRKLKQAGAVIVGKLNMDEFAMGSSTENSAFGPTMNPWDLSRTPGGSSGGSAAAVSARLVPGALGTDTGGSIRQPASLTGCVGLKPTYGRVSRYGVIAFASSLDQVGPFAGDVRGAALLLQEIAGRDENDQTSSVRPVPDYTAALETGTRGLTIGIPREYFGEGLAPEVERAVRAGVEKLPSLGWEIRDISLPNSPHAIAPYYIVATAEASSNLARYDGVRYGHRAKATQLLEMYEKTRAEGFGAEVKRR